MGNRLDIPILSVKSEHLIHNNIHIQNMAMQGYRLTMEDYYSIYNDNKYLYVGVYDGHGGDCISLYLCQNFLKHISKYINKIKSNYTIKTKTEIIENAFIDFDNLIQKNILFNVTQGSTAVCVAISNKKTIILNCGDSRAILYNGRNVIYETTDFKPCVPVEERRIKKSGRKITNNYRIDGEINVSRGFGDYKFKTSSNVRSHAIIAIPEIKIINNNLCKFIVLITDGITNVMENDDLCNYIEYNLQINTQLSIITENILKYCIYKHSTDNMTISIILLYKYDFNNTLNIIEANELNIIYKRVLLELKTNKNKYKTYNMFKLLSLIKTIDYDLKFSAGFRYNYIKSLYKKYA
ncbi:protein phosphatase 1B [Adoxophyes honmai entomopoxvirus 'L']|uniref:Protein phosphatase 1B n=1 Tax=Adoxophyes honmai entomopoxvirus 'L' TaxID=1293540 RepID=A0A916KP12_9POXV|nr:protein phosphatase 1B [Adoxophyes honmai entomopoxvirus 'L']CCU55418.1 protein phosphatase 1B [Adoxophyes honmai entomopoxvirus 'L']